MGKFDQAAKAFFKDPQVYADVFNLAYYHGEPIVSGKDIIELDPSEAGKQRDLLRKVKIAGSGQQIISGLELQCYHDDTMPYRSSHYDIRQYEQQLRNMSKNDQITYDEKDKHKILCTKTEPVLTMVLSLCHEKWKGTVSLKDMTDLKDENLIRAFPDYKMHLLDPHTMEDELIEKCRTELKYILLLVKYRNNVKKFKELTNKMKGVKLSREALEVIDKVVGVRVNKKKEEVTCNMYEAQEMWLEEEKAKLRKQHEKEIAKERKAKEKAQKEMKEAKEAKENALKQTKEVKEKAKQEKDYSLVQMLYQLVTDHVLSKSEAIRRSGMSSYKFMKIVRQMNPGV